MNIKDEQAMLTTGRTIAAQLKPGMLIFLKGDLGAGKTTLVRGILRGLGHSGAVKSPTYNIVEPYEINGTSVFHFDLYRLNEPEELEYMGIRDYINDNSICFIEWPDKGEGLLPAADLQIHIKIHQSERDLLLIPAIDL